MKYFEVNFRIEAPEELMQTGRDVLSAMAGEAGFETFEETEEGITGYVQQQLLERQLLDDLVDNFPLPDTTVSYDISEAEYRDWNEEWEQQGFDPIVVDRYVIHDGKHLPHSPFTPSSLPSPLGRRTLAQQELSTLRSAIGRLRSKNSQLSARPKDACAARTLNSQLSTQMIEIHARQAFGTGTHKTTQMMVATLAAMELEGKRLLDCGTGTGILAIVALKGGAREAVGYDIDEWSTDNARHNATLNGVDERMKVLLGDVSVLNEVEGSFDVVLANINRNILLADMPAMVAKLTPGGTLALSGFLTADVPLLLAKAGELGLTLTAKKNEAEWVCLVFTSKTRM